LQGKCRKCGHDKPAVAGGEKRIADDDRAYEATAVCLECRQTIGTIRVEVSTLFGLREDEAVLHGRPRVY
jgi:hypothetical protein